MGTPAPALEPVLRHLGYVPRLAERSRGAVDLLVLHCTELPDLATARAYADVIHYPGTRSGNSGHYYIDRDGSCEEWVPAERVAHHVAGLNARSLGIELVNRGRFPHWFRRDAQVPHEAYPAAQLESLVALVARLAVALPALRFVAGHEHLDTRRVPASDAPGTMIRRKIDPGPRFPWEPFLARTALRFVTARELPPAPAGRHRG